MIEGLLIVSAIVVLLIGLSGRFSREHYIYASINPEEKKESEDITLDYRNCAPYYCSLKNTIDTIYDC